MGDTDTAGVEVMRGADTASTTCWEKNSICHKLFDPSIDLPQYRRQEIKSLLSQGNGLLGQKTQVMILLYR